MKLRKGEFQMADKKPRIRVVDLLPTATAGEAEALLNAPCDDGYYLNRLVQTGIPEGVGIRAIYALRLKPERYE